MVKKIRVGVDVDGVLCDLHTPCFKTAKEMFGLDLSTSMMDEWDFEKLLPQARIQEFWDRVGEPGFLQSAKPLPGAVEGLLELSEVADVFIVTAYLSNGKQWVHERDQWVLDHFAIPRHKMVHTKAKYTFNGRMLIDDKPQNVIEWASDDHTPAGAKPVLWARPYNESFHEEFNGPASTFLRILRTNDWTKVAQIADIMSARYL